MDSHARFIVNLATRRVHRRTEAGRVFEACNTDQINRKTEVRSREEVHQVLGRKQPRFCKRCFPKSHAEEVSSINDPGDAHEAQYAASDANDARPEEEA